MKLIREERAVIEIDENPKISKKLEVFYNPIMKLNRDLTVLLLNSVPNTKMNIADIMSGTGVRSIRLIKELKKGKIKKICVNDMNSIQNLKKNFRLNKVKANLSSDDANLFLLKSNGFDYIDIDPFGSPNDFLDSSIKRISRDGILAITATDTPVLTGVWRDTCRRIYWSSPIRNGFMHESSLRILARKVQLIGFQYEKALIPMFSYAKDHYVRIFFKCIKSNKACEEIIKQHKYIFYNQRTLEYEITDCNCRKDWIVIGPLFIGSLNDKELVKKMMNSADKETKKFLNFIYNELDIVGSYDLHDLGKILKTKVPNFNLILKKAKATRTHYNEYAIKTKSSVKELASYL